MAHLASICCHPIGIWLSGIFVKTCQVYFLLNQYTKLFPNVNTSIMATNLRLQTKQLSSAWLLSFVLLLGLGQWSQPVMAAEGESLFRVISPMGAELPAELKGKVNQVILLQPNPTVWQQIVQDKPSQIRIRLADAMPQGGDWDISLSTRALTKPGFRISAASKGSNQQSTNQDHGLSYQGRVLADGKQIEANKITLAAMTIFKEEIYGQFATSAGNYTLGLLPGLLRKDQTGKLAPVYVLYNDRDLVRPHDLRCADDESLPNFAEALAKLKRTFAHQLKAPSIGNKRTTSACRQVSIGVETDYALFQRYGNDTNAVKRFAIALFNLVQQQYANEGVALGLQSLLMWDQPDPYANLNSAQQLQTLQQLKGGNTPADLVHLLSGLDLNQTSAGGIAYLNAICSTFNVGLSIVSNNLAPLPIYTWNSSVVAHELGHNFGSLHTHNCNWPTAIGASTTAPIDTCVAVEGQCYQGPPIPKIGTIMSYCHLLASIDLTQGFGPLPGFVLRDTYANAPCLTGDRAPFYSFSTNSPVCAGQALNVGIDSAGTGIVWTWTGPNGFRATGPNFSIPSVTNQQAGRYTLVGDIGGCSTNTRTVDVVVNCYPSADNAFNKAYCVGDSVFASVLNVAGSPANTNFSLWMQPTNQPTASPVNIGAGRLGASNLINLKGRIPAISGHNQFYLLVGDGTKRDRISPDSIRISNQLLTIGYDTVGCLGGPVTLRPRGATTATDLFSWYASTSASTPLATGSSYSTPNLADTTTYYLSKQTQVKMRAGIDTGNGGNFRQRYSRGLLFRVLTPIRLDTFDIFTDGPGIFAFSIKRREYPTQTDQVFLSNDYTLPSDGKHVIATGGVTLQPGQYYIDAEGSTGMGLWRVMNGVTFPYTVPNVVSILTGSFMPDKNDVYFYFFNWRITSLGCESVRMPITINTLTSTSRPTITQVGNRLTAGPSVRTEWFTSTGTVPFATAPSIPLQSGVRAKIYGANCPSAFSAVFTTTNLQTASRSSFRLYPNPSNGTVTLTWDQAQRPADILVLDAIGRQVMTIATEQTAEAQTIDLSGLANGLYFVKVGSQMQRLVIE